MALQEKARLESENEEVRRQLHDRERKLDKAEDALQSRNDQLSKQEKMVESNQRRLAEKLEDATRRQKELDDLLDLERQTMHQLSGLSREDAETRLLGRLEKELVREQGALIARYEREAVEKTAAKAKEMLITSVQRYAAAHTAESTTSTVDIPNDEMKGRIIGREGRNIRAIEKARRSEVMSPSSRRRVRTCRALRLP
jgi:ribonuclease Y